MSLFENVAGSDQIQKVHFTNEANKYLEVLDKWPGYRAIIEEIGKYLVKSSLKVMKKEMSYEKPSIMMIKKKRE